MIKATSLCVVSLIVGGSTGWALHGAQPPQIAAMQPPALRAVFPIAPETKRGPDQIDISELRAMMREELANAMAADQGNANRAPTVAVPASAALKAERRVAMEDIEIMLGGGQWGDRERATFHQKIAMLDPKQAELALQQVVRGMREGSLRVTTNGPPL